MCENVHEFWDKVNGNDEFKVSHRMNRGQVFLLLVHGCVEARPGCNGVKVQYGLRLTLRGAVARQHSGVVEGDDVGRGCLWARHRSTLCRLAAGVGTARRGGLACCRSHSRCGWRGDGHHRVCFAGLGRQGAVDWRAG